REVLPDAFGPEFLPWDEEMRAMTYPPDEPERHDAGRPEPLPPAPEYPMAPPVGYQQGYGEQYPMPKPGNGLGITAMVLGIVSIPLFFLNALYIPIAALAIIFAIVALVRRKPGGKQGYAITGLVTGIIGLI